MILSSDRRLRIDRLTPLEDSTTKELNLQEVGKSHIEKVLAMTSWRVSGNGGAAEILGLKPTTLEARMKKFEIRRPQQSR